MPEQEVGMLRRAIDKSIMRMGDMLPGMSGKAQEEMSNRIIRCTAMRNILDGVSIYLDDMITEELVTIYLTDKTEDE